MIMHVSIPIQSFAVGMHGPYETDDLPADIAGWHFDFENDGTWPEGGDVLKVHAEVSVDGGPFEPDASITYQGGAWTTRQGMPTRVSHWTTTLPVDGRVRRARFTLEVIQPLALGIELSSF